MGGWGVPEGRRLGEGLEREGVGRENGTMVTVMGRVRADMEDREWGLDGDVDGEEEGGGRIEGREETRRGGGEIVRMGRDEQGGKRVCRIGERA